MERQIIVAVKGVIVHKHEALILKRSSQDEFGASTWECAGGKIEFGEGLETALAREITEETGLTVTVHQLLYATTFQTSEQRQVVILTYACTAHHIKVMLSNEHADYLWATKAQMMELLPQPILHDLTSNCVWEQLFIK